MQRLLPSLLAATVCASMPVSAQDPDGKASSPVNTGGSPAATAAPASANPALPNTGGAVDPLGNSNIVVVQQWDRVPGGGAAQQYNDIWGYTSPDGREFAIVGEVAGIWIVETTDPANIRQVGFWSAPGSTWRDFDNLGGIVYGVSEGHRGIRILDLTNPDRPVDHGYVATSQIHNAHNITADHATGYLYLSGTNQGLAIFDAGNRLAPTLVNNWTTNYTHDCCVLRGRAYLSNGRAYKARIMDASNPANLVQIGECNTPGGYDHNVWVSDDDQVLCATDEIGRNGVTPHMTTWDISNPASPVQVGGYDLRTVVHNVFVIGRTAYISHYVDGVEVVDLADPANPTRVANYDTSTIPSGYNGCWGIYPFSDSGLVYASDMQNGLYVMELQAGHMNRYGAGTAGTGNLVPRAKFGGATPRVGAANLSLEVSNVAPSATFYVLLGFAQQSSSALGIDVHVDPGQSITAQFTADANGEASIPLPIPNDAGLANQRIYMQLISVDPNGPRGLAASRGMWSGIAQ